ncbi:MAG: hypothetical protein ABI851_04290 [Saprospiraceae bacterium]
MSNTILIALFAFLIIATIIVFVSIYNKLSKQLSKEEREKESLRISYDQLRKEKIELDDQIQLSLNQEKTYKVAYEDWKSKYDLLESKFNVLRKEIENKTYPTGNQTNLKTEEEVIEVKSKALDSNQESKTNSNNNQNEISLLTSDLRNILNQHLQILSKVINSESGIQLMDLGVKSDPLHWIMGIDEDISSILKNQGIRTFEQLHELPKKELRKLMLQFEDIDERLIESWPMQAGAIIRSQAEKE